MNFGVSWAVLPDWLGPWLLLVFLSLYVAAVVVHGLRSKYRRIYGRLALLHSAKIALLSIPAWVFQLAVLTLVLLPWWWLAGLVAIGIDRLGVGGSPGQTLVFLCGLLALHLVYWPWVFFGPGPNSRFDDRSAAVPTDGRRVAVIGAGMAGLVAAKELQEEGHQVVVYERTEDWGGVWASSKQRGGRAWATTMTSTGSLNTTLSDCPFLVHHPENGQTPLHFSREQFAAMLTAYERRYRVFEGTLETKTEVQTMRRSGSKWILGVGHAGQPTSELRDEQFDAVTVCTGLNHEPWIPDLPGRGTFAGPELHVDRFDFAHPEAYAGRRVLVVGVGESASDLAQDLVDAGVGELLVAPRGSTVTLSRNFGSVPPDYNENRLVYSGPMFYRWGLLLSGLPIMVTNLIKPTRQRSGSFLNWLRLFRPHRTSSAFPSIMGTVNATKSDNLWRVLDAGKATLTKQVEAITPTGVRLRGGTELSVDAIVYCTGYRTLNNFLPTVEGSAGAAPALSARGLYNLTVHPDLPGVAVIGYARGMIGAITLSTELQSRWWALLLSGRRTLPDAKTMRREARKLEHRSRRFSQATRTTLTLAASLARNDIGCEADLASLFRTDRALWWRVLNGPICGAQFRLHGTGAKPELAREQLTLPGAFHADRWVDAVDVGYNILPLVAFSQPIWPVVRRVLPIPSTKGALDCYI